MKLDFVWGVQQVTATVRRENRKKYNKRKREEKD